MTTIGSSVASDVSAFDQSRSVAREGWVLLVGRLLLASLFLVAGWRMIGETSMFRSYMANYGVPAPGVLLPIAMVIQIGAGLMLACGIWTRWAALVLLCYTLLLMLIFHAFWTVDAKQFQSQLNLFLFHLVTIGGLLYVFVFGPGGLSVERALLRPNP